MADPESPQSGAYDYTRSRTPEERASLKRGDTTPVASEDLGARVAALESWQKSLHGKNGISVKGDIISLSSMKSGGSAAAAAQPLDTLSVPGVCINGVAYTVVFYVVSVTPD